MTPVTPKLSALIVCDMIIHDIQTHKKSVIGIFSNIAAVAFPASHPTMSVYFCVSDAEGEYRFELRLVDLESGQSIGSENLPPVRIPDRLQAFDCGVHLINLTFPHAGKYEFQLFANDEFLGGKDFSVTLMPEFPPPGEDDPGEPTGEDEGEGGEGFHGPAVG